MRKKKVCFYDVYMIISLPTTHKRKGKWGRMSTTGESRERYLGAHYTRWSMVLNFLQTKKLGGRKRWRVKLSPNLDGLFRNISLNGQALWDVAALEESSRRADTGMSGCPTEEHAIQITMPGAMETLVSNISLKLNVTRQVRQSSLNCESSFLLSM